MLGGVMSDLFIVVAFDDDGEMVLERKHSSYRSKPSVRVYFDLPQAKRMRNRWLKGTQVGSTVYDQYPDAKIFILSLAEWQNQITGDKGLCLTGDEVEV